MDSPLLAPIRIASASLNFSAFCYPIYRTPNIRLRSLFAALEERDEAAEKKAAPKAEA